MLHEAGLPSGLPARDTAGLRRIEPLSSAEPQQAGNGLMSASELRERELAELMLRMSRGCNRSFARLFDREQRAMHHFFVRLCRCPNRAEDLLQNTFLSLWRYRENFEARGKASAYLYRIGFNQWRQSCRQENRRQALHANFSEWAISRSAVNSHR